MRGTRIVGVLLAAALPAALLGAPAAAEPRAGDVLDSVNTFIGSKDDGNTFPGASMPFGMVQVVPS